MPENLILPPTAALAVRRQAWIENVSKEPFLKGRSKGFPAQGEDYEPLLYIYKAGWKILYNPEMVVYHQIDLLRFSSKNLNYLCFANGLPTFPLRMIITSPGMRPIAFLRHEAGSFFRMMRHLWKVKAGIFKDPIDRAEFKFYLGTFLSPYFYVFLLFRFLNRDRHYPLTH